MNDTRAALRFDAIKPRAARLAGLHARCLLRARALALEAARLDRLRTLPAYSRAMRCRRIARYAQDAAGRYSDTVVQLLRETTAEVIAAEIAAQLLDPVGEPDHGIVGSLRRLWRGAMGRGSAVLPEPDTVEHRNARALGDYARKAHLQRCHGDELVIPTRRKP